MADHPITLLPAGAGRTLHAFGEAVTILVDGATSGGAFTQWIEDTPPGGGPPPHRHQHEDESFFILSGRVAFFEGRTGAWTELGPGGSAFLPRGSMHTFKNVGPEPARMLITTVPSGFETFFARCAEVFRQPGGPDMGRIMAIAAEHGIEFLPPS